MPIKIAHSVQDARTKICPHLPVDILVEEIDTGRAMHRVERYSLCRASDCMMWRWIRTHINDGVGGPMEESTDTHGYCGLGGMTP